MLPRFGRKYRWRKLQRVADDDDLVDVEVDDRNEEIGLQALTSLVDDQARRLDHLHGASAAAVERGEDDDGVIEHLPVVVEIGAFWPEGASFFGDDFLPADAVDPAASDRVHPIGVDDAEEELVDGRVGRSAHEDRQLDLMEMRDEIKL